MCCVFGHWQGIGGVTGHKRGTLDVYFDLGGILVAHSSEVGPIAECAVGIQLDHENIGETASPRTCGVRGERESARVGRAGDIVRAVRIDRDRVDDIEVFTADVSDIESLPAGGIEFDDHSIVKTLELLTRHRRRVCREVSRVSHAAEIRTARRVDRKAPPTSVSPPPATVEKMSTGSMTSGFDRS